MKSAALEYAAAGWRIFPVNRTADSSKPFIKNWPALASADQGVVAGWWDEWPDAAIGAVPASVGLLCVDYDTKHGATITELRAALQEHLGGELPETALVARSPSGGEHHYYRVDGQIASGNKVGHDNVDIRCAGTHYIVLPPSFGGRYEWTSGGHAAPLPLAAYSVLGRPKEKADQEWKIEPDLPENIDLAEKWLRSDECSPSIEGQGGNQALFATAAMMASFGLSQEKAADLLDEIYNVEKCEPPWERQDIERTIGNAYRYHTSSPGNMTPSFRKAAMGFTPIADAVVSDSDISEKPKTWFRITDRDEALNLPPPQWLLKDYLQDETFAILTGGYATYKTFLALDMALSIAAMPEKSLWATREQGPVVFALGEGRAGLGKRLRAWEKHNGVLVPTKNILFVDPVPHISRAEHEIDQLVNALRELHDDYKLLVIDTMGRAMAGQNENAPEVASTLSALANTLRDKLGCTVLAIGHTRKDRTLGQGATRGSGIFENDADTVFTVERNGEKAVTLENVKQKDAPEAEARTFQLKEVRTSLTDTSLVLEEAEWKGEPSKEARAHTILNQIDEAGIHVLKCAPQEMWSHRNLAEQIARSPKIELSPDRIRRYLTQIAGGTGFRMSEAYQPGTGSGASKWKYPQGES